MPSAEGLKRKNSRFLRDSGIWNSPQDGNTESLPESPAGRPEDVKTVTATLPLGSCLPRRRSALDHVSRSLKISTSLSPPFYLSLFLPPSFNEELKPGDQCHLVKSGLDRCHDTARSLPTPCISTLCSRKHPHFPEALAPGCRALHPLLEDSCPDT